MDKKTIIDLSVLSIIVEKEELFIRHKIPKKTQTAISIDLIPKDNNGKIDNTYEHIKNKLFILNSDSNPKRYL
ncbi:hypothetical protein [Aquimarina amphilecti]|uniref:hypothetical protein n=1 Tax=Aquimarina amphilecti TaxID=1038014 RepID=UPI00147D2366|nr:hypothetical protein [Aquimarina amphilecti]